jgi:hypothetical protein
MARSRVWGVRDRVAAGDITTDHAISGTVRQHHGELAFIGSLLVRRPLLSATFFGQTGSERRSSWRASRANLLRLRSHRAGCALGAVIPLQHWSSDRGEPSGWKVTLAAWIRMTVAWTYLKVLRPQTLISQAVLSTASTHCRRGGAFLSRVGNDDAIHSPRVASGWMRDLRERLDLAFEQSLHGRDLRRCFRPEHERRALPTREHTELLPRCRRKVGGWE